MDMLDSSDSILQSVDDESFGPVPGLDHSAPRRYPVDYACFERIYQWFHTYPELVCQQTKTKRMIIRQLRHVKGQVTIEEDRIGHGLYAVMRADKCGHTVMLHANMDAHPLRETTGLEYASSEEMVDANGENQHVMHASGNDFHITVLLAIAKLYGSRRDRWDGTIIFFFQSAAGATEPGASGMVNDDFYAIRNLPVPDYILGQRVAPIPAGLVAIKPGIVTNCSKTFRVTVHDSSGDENTPEECANPTEVADHLVRQLQNPRNIPSCGGQDREDMPEITTGAIHTRRATNLVGKEAVFDIYISAVSEGLLENTFLDVMDLLNRESVEQGCPKPGILPLSRVPVGRNDEWLADKITTALRSQFRDSVRTDFQPSQYSNDLCHFATHEHTRVCMYFVGCSREAAHQGRLNVTMNHSPDFAPAIRPTLQTAIEACLFALRTCLRYEPKKSRRE